MGHRVCETSTLLDIIKLLLNFLKPFVVTVRLYKNSFVPHTCQYLVLSNILTLHFPSAVCEIVFLY